MANKNGNGRNNDPFETFFMGPKFQDDGTNPENGPFSKKGKRIYIICLIVGWLAAFGLIAYIVLSK